MEALSKSVKALVVTQGGQGSTIYANGKSIDIPPVPPVDIVDPTGCGDAYRSGLLYGIANDLDWEVTGRLASLLGSIKIAQRGPQNHELNRDSVAERYREAFGTSLW